MNLLEKIMSILVTPIMILNIGGAIVGGIWLAILGEWQLIGLGLMMIFFSHWVISLFLLLNIPVAMVTIYLEKKQSRLKYIFFMISQIYTGFLILATCFVAFVFCTKSYFGFSNVIDYANVNYKYIPYLLWAWELGLGGWQFLSSKEDDNVYSGLVLLNASIFFFLFISSVMFDVSLSVIVILLWLVTQLLVIPVVNVIMIKNE